MIYGGGNIIQRVIVWDIHLDFISESIILKRIHEVLQMEENRSRSEILDRGDECNGTNGLPQCLFGQCFLVKVGGGGRIGFCVCVDRK